MKKIIPTAFHPILFCCLFISTISYSQAPLIQWSKAYGGSFDDEARAGIPLADGTYVIAGKASSHDGQVNGHHGTDSIYDYWVLKINGLGNITKKKSYGGSENDQCETMLQNANGTFTLAGWSNSTDGDVTGNHGGNDVWVVTLAADLSLDSSHCYGGSNDDYCYYLDNTADGGQLITGWSKSNDGDLTSHHGKLTRSDFWVLKIGGTISYSKSIGGSQIDIARYGVQTADHGYIIGGHTYSDDGDVVGYHGGDADIYVVKLDSVGNIQWSRCYGGSGGERLNAVLPVSTGGYLIGGYTSSIDGDALSNTDTTQNAWLVRIDDSGNIIWEKTLGGSYVESVEDLVEMPDGNFAGIAYTGSADGDIKGHFGTGGDDASNWDCWLFGIDDSGNLLWQGCYGGYSHDLSNDIDITPDGYLFVTGESASSKGQITGTHGADDFWAMKTSVLTCSKSANLTSSYLTSGSALLSWDPVPGARKYSVRVRPTGGVWQTYQTYSLSWAVQNLSALTLYQWQVKTLCDSLSAQASGWTTQKTFTTLEKISNGPSENVFTVFPNPFSTTITLSSVHPDEGTAEITLYSVSGNILLKKDWNTQQTISIETSQLPSGIYLLFVKSRDKNLFTKLVKQ